MMKQASLSSSTDQGGGKRRTVTRWASWLCGSLFLRLVCCWVDMTNRRGCAQFAVLPISPLLALLFQTFEPLPVLFVLVGEVRRGAFRFLGHAALFLWGWESAISTTARGGHQTTGAHCYHARE